VKQQVVRTDWKNGRVWHVYEDRGPSGAASHPLTQLEAGPRDVMRGQRPGDNLGGRVKLTRDHR
jgi:hypothetical protein